MHDAAISAQLDAAWGDPASWVSNGLQWTHLEEIQTLINRRVSGDPSATPLAWFARYLQAAGALPLRRALVLGCGAGRIERALHEQGWAREIVAFDLSPKVLDKAREAAAGIDSIHYVLASMDDLPVGAPPFMPGSFDAVFGVASVHHCAQLERLFAAVSRLLTPDGWFFMDEYTGPDRFQYSPSHLQQVTALAELLPDRLLTTLSGQVKRGFRAPTVAEVVAVDPSEAVCSSRILTVLQETFDIVAQRPYGGSLLHVLLADIAQNFQPAPAKPWLQALIDAEDDLDRLGALEQHFSCVIARPRPAATGAPIPAR
ncbi:MAG: class I SAM-dependent methyltransferase [Comamonadaceae bacterium]|nr:MAG: class I SAM-dependent methyltransferase [Comamonadaceae bacterium]